MKLLNKIWRKWIKWRLQPIRVFCIHHVTESFDADSMNECDWTQMDDFKNKVLSMQQDGVEFVSLTEAYNKIANDKFRNHKYAVLTFDDGYASLKEILPWLEERRIPATLFINGKYLDGKSYRTNPKERYMTREELFALTSPLIEIANHGWEHKRITEMTYEEFVESVERNVALLSAYPNYIPFWAYTYGTYGKKANEFLQQKHIVPVYVSGNMNYNDASHIDRELISSERLKMGLVK